MNPAGFPKFPIHISSGEPNAWDRGFTDRKTTTMMVSNRRGNPMASRDDFRNDRNRERTNRDRERFDVDPFYGARGYPDWDRTGSFREREDVNFADGGRNPSGFGRSNAGYAQPEYRYRERDRDDDGRRYGQSGREEKRDFIDRASDEVASWFGDEGAERRREQDQHRGKGPKGYVRRDERILEDVNDRLMQDSYVDASDIEVMVAEAEVTLSGTVASRQDKRRAEDLADSVSGVAHVQNNIRVKTGTIANIVS
jgi:osmotically-inducible protein OsmY